MQRAADVGHRKTLMVAAAVGLCATISAVAALPAFAHTSLLSSSPEQGSTIEAPAQVELVFSEALIDVGGEMSVLGADGVETELTVTYPQPDTAAATLPVLADGSAVVTWRVVSGDGHPVEGTLDFVVTGSAQAVPSSQPSPIETPTPEPTVSPTSDLVVTPISVEPEPAGGLPPWLWATLLVTVVAGASVAMATSKRR